MRIDIEAVGHEQSFRPKGRPNQAEDSELQAELQGAQMRLKNAQRITSTKALLGKLPSACDRVRGCKGGGKSVFF